MLELYITLSISLSFESFVGVSYYYFEGANHSRFEHSIGTAYLCMKILDIIERNSDVKIDENHKKCVVVSKIHFPKKMSMT
jgi:hypothetical protein